jgi:starch phosphorylase
MAHKVNGVSALHTELMKTTVFEELNRLHPDRIVNADQRRDAAALAVCPATRPARPDHDTIGEDWVTDLEQLRKLEAHVDDAGFRARYAAAKRANKAGWPTG